MNRTAYFISFQGLNATELGTRQAVRFASIRRVSVAQACLTSDAVKGEVHLE
jgi:hypothetical protein